MDNTEVTPPERPDWDALFAVAELQAGLFTTGQAAENGCSSMLLQKHLRSGRIARVRRGVYRFVRFPEAEHEGFVVLWLWSDQAGVFSHQTALMLHELSDALPSKADLTVPREWEWRHSQRRVPEDLVLHFGEVADDERDWLGAVPLTTPRRTISDCIEAHVPPDLVEQAVHQAHARGILTEADVAEFSERLSRALAGAS